MWDTRELNAQLRALGVRAGDRLMVHASLRAVGPVAGGPPGLLAALLEALGPEGTLLAYASWQHSSYDATLDGRELTREERDAWPVFEPATAPPYDGFGKFNRFVCAHPGAQRSAHPDASIVAIGRRAADLAAHHSLLDGYGPASPLGRFAVGGGRILMLGAPPGAVTVLHVAEAIARVPGKRRVRYQVPVRVDGQRCWREAEEFDTNALLDQFVASGFDAIAGIATDYVAQGSGLRGRVGDASCWLLDAQDLVAFGVRWLESRFGAGPGDASPQEDREPCRTLQP
ncbi:aminoglycoside 3-N-acetyltransferase [Ramlibacter sp. G-1-2-2]|uniref:Aminoglycoside N(3)-acetyltransferase n=1 Tax=Ramlibacter agri TaxID=2728837 RepID=A0A848H4F4_9BURK|nr:aminoglycoside 3-N-acetyltransferase [Ramlibacter agri]